MSGKAWLALLCLVAGVALASYGLAYGALLLALAGLALVMTFVYVAYAWVAGASRPMGAQAGKVTNQQLIKTITKFKESTPFLKRIRSYDICFYSILAAK